MRRWARSNFIRGVRKSQRSIIPDRLIFDLDPDESVPFDAVKLAAKDLRRRLKTKGLESYLKCTGGKGLHVSVPLAEKDNWEDVKAFCAEVAGEMVEEVPARLCRDDEQGEAQRAKSSSIISGMITRPRLLRIIPYGRRAGAPVAVPLEWRELEELRAANQFTIADVLKRLKQKPPNARGVARSLVRADLEQEHLAAAVGELACHHATAGPEPTTTMSKRSVSCDPEVRPVLREPRREGL